MTPILQKLHWLPVRQHIHFKILVITYKSINDMEPEYMCELVFIRKSSRKLRSSRQILLLVPVSRLNLYVIVHLVLQPPLCGIGCWQILEMRCLSKMLNPF